MELWLAMPAPVLTMIASSGVWLGSYFAVYLGNLLHLPRALLTSAQPLKNQSPATHYWEFGGRRGGFS